MLKNWEINRMEEIGLVTPAPDQYQSLLCCNSADVTHIEIDMRFIEFFVIFHLGLFGIYT